MTGPTPRVSVVTAYYNRAGHVDRTIRSLLAQTLRDIEIIVVDDGSTDGTAAEIAKLDDPRIVCLRIANAGFVNAMNHGISHARGAYIAVQGSGDISLPGRLEQQAAILDAYPDVALVGCAWRDGPRIMRPQGGTEPCFFPLRETMQVKSWLSHGEAMYRRADFQAVGGYRPFFRYAQDRDLWLRLGARGERLVILPDILYERFYLPDGVSRSPAAYRMQCQLARFALQCARNVDAGGEDLLDRHGPLGYVVAGPSRTTARMLTMEGLRWVCDGRVEEGRAAFAAAWNEIPTRYSLLARGLLALPPGGWAMRWLVQPLLRILGKGRHD